MSDGALATYEFRRGALAGSHLSLFRSQLVHRTADGFEAIALDRIGAVSVAFERDHGRVTGGTVLLLIALGLLAAFWPLRMLVASAMTDALAQAQPGSFLPAALHVVESCVGMLPYLSIALALWATALLALGWIGETVLRLVVAPSEREFAVRGREPLLLEFAEAAAARLSARD